MDAPPPKVHDLGLKIMKTNPQLAAVTLELERTRNSRYHPALSIRYHPREIVSNRKSISKKANPIALATHFPHTINCGLLRS
jgi:hypothetical protein